MKAIILILVLALFPASAYARDKHRHRDSYNDYKRSDSTYQRDRENLRRYMGMELDYGKRREAEKRERDHSKRKR